MIRLCKIGINLVVFTDVNTTPYVVYYISYEIQGDRFQIKYHSNPLFSFTDISNFEGCDGVPFTSLTIQIFMDSLTDVPTSGALIKTASAEISVDTTTTATIAAPATLLSIAITPDNASNKFIVSFTASGDLNSNTDGKISFQLFYGITGLLTKRRSTYIFHDRTVKEAGSCALSMRLDALGSGEHTIEIKWGRTTSTARIRPVTDPNYDHATLIIQEVKA
jgi:hypothetical protein